MSNEKETLVCNYKEIITENKKSSLEINTLAANLLSAIELRKALPRDRGKCFKLLRKFSKIKVNKIIEEANVSERTYKRASTGEKVSKESMVRICLSMHIPYILTEHLLEITGNTLSNSKDEIAWKLMLMQYYELPLEDIIEILKTMQVKIF